MIVDASVAFKWFAPEDGSDEAVALLESAVLAAPTLLLVEVANALWKMARRDRIDAAVSFAAEIEDLGRLVEIRDAAPLAARALELARALDHPVYDCVYLALAERDGERLVTADAKFARRAGDRGFGASVVMLA